MGKSPAKLQIKTFMKKTEALNLFENLKSLLEKQKEFISEKCLQICNENFILVMSSYDKNWTFDIIYYDTIFRFVTDIKVSHILKIDFLEARFSSRQDFIEIFDENFEEEMAFKFINGKIFENAIFNHEKYDEILQSKKEILGDWENNDYLIRFGESNFKIFFEDETYVGHYHIYNNIIKLNYGEASNFLNKKSDIFRFRFGQYEEHKVLMFHLDKPVPEKSFFRNNKTSP